ncbi:uncharacterized protein PRCAT00005011001 [Priceomyces carsonii]|uniref:uncharacterized protein n=1 Tax=Priceomyces carsonii TaxID=28549 RepID=UPI002ED7A03A|nr:unnamed protein product [Priceomyces carsonii]
MEELNTASTTRHIRLVSIREGSCDSAQILPSTELQSVQEPISEDFKTQASPTLIDRILYGDQDIATWLNIVNGSIWGVLAREGVKTLTTFPGSYLLGVVWANFGACVAMGVFLESYNIWKDILDSNIFKLRNEIAVYTGITTGFCGAFSSFPSAILEIFYMTSNTVPPTPFEYPSKGYGVVQFFSVTIAQFGLSIVGFQLGRHASWSIDAYLPRFSKTSLKVVNCTAMAIGLFAFITICILIGIQDVGTWRSWVFACFFAPFGALLRFYISRGLNPVIKNFPLGTFIANSLGTLLIAVFTLVSRGKQPGFPTRRIVNKYIACHILVGLDDGFCGALTTVSAFVVELFRLKRFDAYKYGIFSVGISFAMTMIILGSFNWTVGLTLAVCT